MRIIDSRALHCSSRKSPPLHTRTLSHSTIRPITHNHTLTHKHTPHNKTHAIHKNPFIPAPPPHLYTYTQKIINSLLHTNPNTSRSAYTPPSQLPSCPIYTPTYSLNWAPEFTQPDHGTQSKTTLQANPPTSSRMVLLTPQHHIATSPSQHPIHYQPITTSTSRAPALAARHTSPH